MIDSVLIYFIFGIFGLVFGSFSTVLAYRIPNDISIIHPGSKCHYCEKPLTLLELIPVASFLISRGISKCCNSKIPLVYPLTEIATSFLFMFSYHITGFRLSLISILTLSVLSMPLLITDITLKRLPNKLTLSGFIASIFVSLVNLFNAHSGILLLQTLLFSFVSGFTFLLLNIISKGGMGMGDVKLAGMLGALLSPFGGSVIFISYVFAFIFGALIGVLLLILKAVDRKSMMPFGPYMIIGAWTSLALPQETIQAITGLWLP